MSSNFLKLKQIAKEFVEFSQTVKGRELIDANNSKKAIMLPVHKEPKIAITKVVVEAGFIHKSHVHSEVEILILLKGKAMSYHGSVIEEMEINKPITFKAGIAHENHFIDDSEVLAITIPADKDFPDDIK